MSDMNMAKFESEVEKGCAQWVNEVVAAIQKCRSDIKTRTDNLEKKLKTLTPPKPDGKELLGVVKDIVTQETRDIKDLVVLQILFGVNPQAKKFTNMGADV